MEKNCGQRSRDVDYLIGAVHEELGLPPKSTTTLFLLGRVGTFEFEFSRGFQIKKKINSITFQTKHKLVHKC